MNLGYSLEVVIVKDHKSIASLVLGNLSTAYQGQRKQTVQEMTNEDSKIQTHIITLTCYLNWTKVWHVTCWRKLWHVLVSLLLYLSSILTLVVVQGWGRRWVIMGVNKKYDQLLETNLEKLDLIRLVKDYFLKSQVVHFEDWENSRRLLLDVREGRRHSICLNAKMWKRLGAWKISFRCILG